MIERWEVPTAQNCPLNTARNITIPVGRTRFGLLQRWNKTTEWAEVTFLFSSKKISSQTKEQGKGHETWQQSRFISFWKLKTHTCSRFSKYFFHFIRSVHSNVVRKQQVLHKPEVIQ